MLAPSAEQQDAFSCFRRGSEGEGGHNPGRREHGAQTLLRELHANNIQQFPQNSVAMCGAASWFVFASVGTAAEKRRLQARQHAPGNQSMA